MLSGPDGGEEVENPSSSIETGSERLGPERGFRPRFRPIEANKLNGVGRVLSVSAALRERKPLTGSGGSSAAVCGFEGEEKPFLGFVWQLWSVDQHLYNTDMNTYRKAIIVLLKT